MKVFAAAGFKKGYLAKLNQYRMYLQVVMLVDILDGLGDNVCNIALSGIRNQ